MDVELQCNYDPFGSFWKQLDSKAKEKDSKSDHESFTEKIEQLLPTWLIQNKPRILLIFSIIWGFTSNTILSMIDVITDFKLSIEYFMSKDIIWGLLTFALTFVPAILAALREPKGKKWLQFRYHLPFIQLYKHSLRQWHIAKAEREVKKWDRKLIIVKGELRQLSKELAKHDDPNDGLETKKKLEEDYSVFRDASEKKLHVHQSKLQEFKAHEAFGESYPEVILQFTILLKQGFLINLDTKSSTFTSLVMSWLNLLVTISGLTISLPFYIYNQKQVQFKSSTLQYCIVLPLMALIIGPRMFTISLFLSFFDMYTGWLSIVILMPLLVAYSIGFGFMMKQTILKNDQDKCDLDQDWKQWLIRTLYPLKNLQGKSSEESGSLKLNFFTSMLIPINIHNPKEEFYLQLNLLTTILYSVLSFVSGMLVTYAFQYLSVPDRSVQTQRNYQIICTIQTVALMLSFFVSYAISEIIQKKNFQNMLLWACAGGVEKDRKVSKLLESKQINPKAFDKDGKTCLMWACQKNLPQTVSKLLSKVDKEEINKCDKYGKNVFMLACQYNSYQVVPILLELSQLYSIDLNQWDQDGKNAFMLACEQNHAQLVLVLLELSSIDLLKCDKEGRNAFMIACSTNSDKVVSILLEHEQNDLMLQKSNDLGENAFILACINDCHKVIPILLEHSHKVDLQKCDNDGQNAFMQACSNNSHKVVPILLEHSAKIDIHKCDNLGLNAFMLACKSNSERVVKAILLKKSLSNDLDLHKCDHQGRNAFMWACSNDSGDKILRLLFEKPNPHNFQFNVQDKDGKTGFIIACNDWKKEKVVNLILEHAKEFGIDLNVKDHNGKTGFDALASIWPEKIEEMDVDQ